MYICVKKLVYFVAGFDEGCSIILTFDTVSILKFQQQLEI